MEAGYAKKPGSPDGSVDKSMDLQTIADSSLTSGWVVFLVRPFSKALTQNCYSVCSAVRVMLDTEYWRSQPVDEDQDHSTVVKNSPLLSH